VPLASSAPRENTAELMRQNLTAQGDNEMMTSIDQRFIRTVRCLAVSVPCLCVTNCVVAPSARPVANQNMSVEEARNFVLEVARPPAAFFDLTGSDEDTDSGKPLQRISHVSIGTTSITVSAKRKYTIPLRDMEPSVRPSRAGWPQVYLTQRLGFYAVSDANPPRQGREAADRLVDALLVLKTAALTLPSPDEEALFQEAARNYRASAPKPSLPEAARRFRVQAEGAVNDKDFYAAADFYQQALGVAPWWPEGHFNRALTLAETGDFGTAILEMMRYLALVPDAPDARAAQDKIYDWERKVGTPH
jgi:hypothetical protein